MTVPFWIVLGFLLGLCMLSRPETFVDGPKNVALRLASHPNKIPRVSTLQPEQLIEDIQDMDQARRRLLALQIYDGFVFVEDGKGAGTARFFKVSADKDIVWEPHGGAVTMILTRA